MNANTYESKLRFNALHVLKCSWCGTQNEAGQKICCNCGVPFSSELAAPVTANRSVSPAPTEIDRTWRILFLILALLPVVMVLAVGGRLLWQRHAQEREAQQEQAGVEAQRLAEGQRQRAEEAERLRIAEVKRQRDETARARIPEVLAKARDYLRRGDFAIGLSVVNELLREVDSAELRETKVDLLNNAGRWNEAYLEIQKVLKIRPDEGYLHLAAANFALNLQGPKAALPHFDNAVRLAPSNTTYQIARANLYVKAGREDEGFALFERMIAEDPQCIDCWYAYGDCLYGVRQYERAIAVVRRAVEKFPESPRHRFLLALVLDAVALKKNDRSILKEAAAEYRKSLEMQPMPNSRAAQRIFAITGQRVPPELEALSPEEVALQPAGKVNLVHVTINGVEGRFILDTGASYTSVFGHAAKRYKLNGTGRVADVKTANGTVQVPVSYGAVQVGKQKQSPAVILLLPEGEKDGIDGLLGMDFLNTFNGQIDIDHGRLVLLGAHGGV